MSPDSSVTAARPLDDQARALVGFLLAHDHKLAESDAQRLCADLPADPKAAAKMLRSGLAPLNIDIKHTHALKAVAVLRDSAGFLGLDTRGVYEVADWTPDAPGVSAERVRVTSFAKAADEFCRRLREQFEDDAPLVVLRCRRTHVQVRATSKASGAWWNLLLVPLDAGKTEVTFEDRQEVQRLAERVRRIVEGDLGGWVDGMYNVYQVVSDASAEALDAHSVLETDFYDDGSLPAPIADSAPEALSVMQDEWDGFLKRKAFFQRRKDKPLPDWARELRQEAAVPRYGEVEFNLEVLERARATAGMPWTQLAHLFVDDIDGEIVSAMSEGKACLSSLQTVAEALKIDPNALLQPQRATPRIPLPLHSDIAMWLSRMDAVVGEPLDAATPPASIVERLRQLCAVPYVERRGWYDKPPAPLQSLNKEIRFAGLVVSAGMGVRFVKDLPLGMQRPSSMSILEFDREVDVLTQDGALPDGSSTMALAEEETDASPEWLERYNKPKFTGSELLRYADMVHDGVDEADDWRDRFTAKVMVGAKLFPKDAPKIHAATVRMTALSKLIERFPMEPWVRKNRNPEEGSLLIAEAGFEAAARCELVNVDGEPGFDNRAFYLLCVKHERKYS